MSNWPRNQNSTPPLGTIWSLVNKLYCLYNDLKASITSYAAPVYGQLTIQQFRDAETFTKDSFIVTDEGLEGLFVYDPDDTTSADDGINVLVKNNKRYKRQSLGESVYFKPVAQSQLVISNYRKIGTTYYGLISQYTGKEITANLATQKPSGGAITNTDVDNIIYFKFSDGNFAIRNWSNEEIVPEEFGALGNGIVDDRAALVKAFSYTQNILLSKTYKITSPISIVLSATKDLNIRGIDNATIVFDGYYRGLFASSTTGLGSLSLDGIGFKGTMASALDSNNYGVGVYTDNLNQVKIQNCRFTDIYGDGIRVYNNNGTVKVDNNSFVNVAGLDTVTDGSGLVDHYGDGIQIYRSNEVIVSNNVIYNDAQTNGFYGRGGVILETAAKGFIFNNKIKGYSRAIHVEVTTEGSTIHNNRATECPCSLILSNTQDNYIHNNYFSNEGVVDLPYAVGEYLINGYGTSSNNVFRHNYIKIVDGTPITTTTIQGAGNDWSFEYNDIEGPVYLFNTTGFVFYKNKIKSAKITHTNSNTIFNKNQIDVVEFEQGATSARFTENNIFNSGSGGVGTIIGFNSSNFALVDNVITQPGQYILLNDGNNMYGEISGNKLIFTTAPGFNPWGLYPPYFNRRPVFTKSRNYTIIAGVQTDIGFYYSGKYPNTGVNYVYGDTSPATGTWERGDRCININQADGAPKAWTCITAGTPGSWKSEGNL